MSAYFPDSTAGVTVSISQISEEADLALVKGDLSGLKRPILKLDARKEAAISGQPLLSLGYATGLSAILARAGEEAVNEIVTATGGDAKRVVDELVRRKLIRPLVTQGHIGDVLADKIVYDAQTTSGGSGGPLINRIGEVIGVTFAVVRGFGGSHAHPRASDCCLPAHRWAGVARARLRVRSPFPRGYHRCGLGNPHQALPR